MAASFHKPLQSSRNSPASDSRPAASRATSGDRFEGGAARPRAVCGAIAWLWERSAAAPFPVENTPNANAAAPFSPGNTPCRTLHAPSTPGNAPCRTLHVPYSPGNSPCRTLHAPFSPGNAPCRTLHEPFSDENTPDANAAAGYTRQAGRAASPFAAAGLRMAAHGSAAVRGLTTLPCGRPRPRSASMRMAAFHGAGTPRARNAAAYIGAGGAARPRAVPQQTSPSLRKGWQAGGLTG